MVLALEPFDRSSMVVVVHVPCSVKAVEFRGSALGPYTRSANFAAYPRVASFYADPTYMQSTYVHTRMYVLTLEEDTETDDLSSQ